MNRLFASKLYLLLSIPIIFMAILVALPKIYPKSIPRKSEIFSPIKHHANFKTEPANVNAAESEDLIFEIKNDKNENIRFLEFVHEKPLHLMIVSDDLNEFYHIHPELMTDYYSVKNTFPFGGKYHLFSDYTPPGGIRTLENFEVNVAGKPRQKIKLQPDKVFTKTLDGIRVSMEGGKDFVAKKDYLVKFSVSDKTTNQPVNDLQLYLGALAHVAIFSQDLKDFIHAHPLEEGEVYDPSKISFHAHNPEELAKKLVGPSPSEVKVGMIFPGSGIYKMWVQFQRHEKVINVPFVVNVSESEEKIDESDEIPPDAVRVSISKTGFEPSEIKLKKGVPAKLAFTRTDAENCGGTIVFPSLNIKRDLPIGKTAVIEFTPSEAGELSFTCGMGMYKGNVIISD